MIVAACKLEVQSANNQGVLWQPSNYLARQHASKMNKKHSTNMKVGKQNSVYKKEYATNGVTFIGKCGSVRPFEQVVCKGKKASNLV